MAVIITNGNVGLSTVNGFYNVEEYNLAALNTSGNSISTPRTIPLQFLSLASPANCIGAAISLQTTNTSVSGNMPAGSLYNDVLVELQENTGYPGGPDVWVTRASKQLTGVQITNNTTYASGWGWFVPFTFTAPYQVASATVSSGHYKWQLRVSRGTMNRANDFSLGASSGTSWSFLVWCDVQKSFSDNDCVIAKDILTIDRTATVRGVLSTGNGAFGIGMMALSSATPTPDNVANIVWQNPPAAPHTLTVNGTIALNCHSGFRIGTAANRIPAANQAVVSFVNPTVGTYSGIYVNSYNGSFTTRKMSLFLYGERPTDNRAVLAADAPSGQKVITTVSPMGWAQNDNIIIGGSSTAFDYAEQATTYQVDYVAGTVVTLKTNLGRTRKAGAPIVKYSTYGVKIVGNTTTIPRFFLAGPSNLVIDGVEFDVFNGIQPNYLGFAGSYDDPTNRSKHVHTHCLVRNSLAASAPSYLISGCFDPPPEGIEISYIDFGRWGTIAYSAATPFNADVNFKSHVVTIDRCWALCPYSNIGHLPLSVSYSSTLNKFVITNNIFECGGTVVNGACGSYWIIEGNRFWGNYGSATYPAILYNTVFNLSLKNNTFDLCSVSNQVGAGPTPGAVKVIASGNSYGMVMPNIGDTHNLPIGAIFDWEENHPAGTIQVNGQWDTKTVEGASLRFRNCGGVAGDHKSWTTAGKFWSSAGKLVAQTLQAAGSLVNRYSFLTGAVANAKCAAIINCQINNAAYYGGANDLPAMVVSFDDGSTSSVQAAANTGIQKLVNAFTSLTSNNQITFSLSQRTDATGANASVTWDTLILRSRKYGYIFFELTKLVTEILTYIYGEIPTLSPNPFITQPTEATVAAYTGITINHASALITVSENHTIQELYDYCQYNLALEANLDKVDFFSTIDGVNFVCAYDLSVDGCILSGAGKAISLGSKDFQAVNGGSCTAKITDKDGTLVAVALTGVVAGSRCRVFKTSDGTEIMNVEASGSTVAVNYNHTSDIDVTIRVRKASGAPKYLPFETFGTITSNGLSVVVTQVLDTVAA